MKLNVIFLFRTSNPIKLQGVHSIIIDIKFFGELSKVNLCLIPSIRVRSCETILRSTSPLVLSRLGAIESISSMKMMAGAFFSASSKAFLKFDSDSPAIFDMISGPFIRKKKAPVSLATARAIKVLPEIIIYHTLKQSYEREASLEMALSHKMDVLVLE